MFLVDAVSTNNKPCRRKPVGFFIGGNGMDQYHIGVRQNRPELFGSAEGGARWAEHSRRIYHLTNVTAGLFFGFTLYLSTLSTNKALDPSMCGELQVGLFDGLSL